MPPDPRGARPHQAYPLGPTSVEALRGVSLSVAGRRVRRPDGSVGLGQVDPPPGPRRPRPADLGRGRPRGRDRSASCPTTRPPACAATGPVSSSSRSTSSRCSSVGRTSPCRSRSPATTPTGRAARPDPRRHRPRRPDRQGAPQARPAVGGRAAARRHRPRPRDPAGAPLRRRADRQPRLHDRHRDPRCAVALVRGARPDDRPRDPRLEGGGLRRPGPASSATARSATTIVLGRRDRTTPTPLIARLAQLGLCSPMSLDRLAWRSLPARPLRAALTPRDRARRRRPVRRPGDQRRHRRVGRRAPSATSSAGPTCASRPSARPACRARPSRRSRDTSGVAVAAPALERRTYLAPELSRGAALPPPVTVLGIDPTIEPRLHDLTLAAGSALADPTEPSALITERSPRRTGWPSGRRSPRRAPASRPHTGSSASSPATARWPAPAAGPWSCRSRRPRPSSTSAASHASTSAWPRGHPRRS